MKLATYRDGSRDGQLVVVSRDLTSAHFATGIATRMQAVLDDWNFISPQLEDLSTTLNHGKARHAFAFDPKLCLAPLPRAVQWASGLAYLNGVALSQHTNGGAMPARLHTAPLLAQRASDHYLGAMDDAVFSDAGHGIDFGAGLAVVTGDVAPGSTPEQALDAVRLLLLVNDWTLCNLVTAEMAAGFGLLHSKPATAFGPLAVTPDELGPAWSGGRVHAILETTWNGRLVGRTESGPEMSSHFGQLIAHLAATRSVGAGSIVGSGVVSNADPARGWNCIAEQRALETAASGAPRTAFMQFGDTVHIDLKGPDGQSVFGAIEQKVVALR